MTTSDENMWMIPFDSEEGTHFLKITFDEPTVVTGIRVWNYNKSLEDTFRGVNYGTLISVIHVNTIKSQTMIFSDLFPISFMKVSQVSIISRYGQSAKLTPVVQRS